MLLCAAVVCFSLVIFVWSYSIRSCFPKNKVILSSFLGTKKGSIMTYCLNFDVCLCIRIKKIQLEKEGIGIMFFVGF